MVEILKISSYSKAKSLRDKNPNSESESKSRQIVAFKIDFIQTTYFHSFIKILIKIIVIFYLWNFDLFTIMKELLLGQLLDKPH